MANQPKVEVPRTGTERVLQVVGIGAVVAMWAYVARVWSEIPAKVPIHFDLAGTPDGWGSRGELLALPIGATLTFLVCTLLERVPHIHNYPIKITEANAPAVYALSRLSVLWLKLIVILGMGFGFAATVETALGRATGLPGWYSPVFAGSLGVVLIVTVVRMRRSREVLPS